jgi:hypothetical protein
MRKSKFSEATTSAALELYGSCVGILIWLS